MRSHTQRSCTADNNTCTPRRVERTTPKTTTKSPLQRSIVERAFPPEARRFLATQSPIQSPPVDNLGVWGESKWLGRKRQDTGLCNHRTALPLKVRVLKLEGGGMQAFYGVGGVTCNKRQFQVGVRQSRARITFRGIIWAG
jgi:hypothetical protein